MKPPRYGIAAALVAITLSAALGTASAGRTDPPRLILWHRIGDISLGDSIRHVQAEYGGPKDAYHVVLDSLPFIQGYYRLHGTEVDVDYWHDRVTDIGFGTPYYRTSGGFGVGSTIDLGPCFRTSTERCQHRWHGFLWNAWNRGKPCSCWVKVGTGPISLAAISANFLKPWYFIYTRQGKATHFYFSDRFID